ncbi:lmo0937 family membrane protein [Caenibius tardaugens]|uniref:lmo0937 family membrane protein n=1 Tax=Caenibius tardaugens TaxID=169176 RepID=UPI0034E2F02A
MGAKALVNRFLVNVYSRSCVMLLAIAIALVVLWALGFIVFHVSAAAIHLLIFAAVVLLIVHFVRGARAI